jgi:hypothetical protein
MGTLENSFFKVVGLIRRFRTMVVQASNTMLIDLYWGLGEYFSQRIATDGWGKSTVSALATFIETRQPGSRGFSSKNL